jgi:arsenite-transporting ATPase
VFPRGPRRGRARGECRDDDAAKTRIILYSGKGGVGKTSLSAATAIRAAQLGQRTLVVSTDSAHSLRDALDRELGGEPTGDRAAAPRRRGRRQPRAREPLGHDHEFLTRFMTFRGVDETVAEEIAILPGMEELFSLVRVAAGPTRAASTRS